MYTLPHPQYVCREYVQQMFDCDSARLTFRTPRMAIHVFFQGGILRTHSHPQPWYVGIA